MASFLTTKFQKLKETVGAVQPTEDPEEVKEVKEHLRQLKHHNNEVSKYTKQMSSDWNKTAQSGEKFSNAVLEYSKLYTQYGQSPLGETLTQLSDAEMALTSLEKALSCQIQEVFVAPLKQSYEEHLRSASDLKTKQEEARVFYDIAKQRHKDASSKGSDGKNQVKLEEAEHQLNQAKTSYETYNQQLVARLNEFDKVNSVQTIQCARKYMNALLDFYTKGAQLVSEMVPHLDKLEQENNAFIEQLQEQTALALEQQQAQQQMQSLAGSPPSYVAMEDGAPPAYLSEPDLSALTPPPAYVSDPNLSVGNLPAEYSQQQQQSAPQQSSWDWSQPPPVHREQPPPPSGWN